MLPLVAVLSLVSWLYLVFMRGGFWRAGPFVSKGGDLADWPPVVAIVPARNEAATIERCLRSLRDIDYPGELCIILIDDGSSDGTSAIAARIEGGKRHSLNIVTGTPPGKDWAGKVWAMAQGVESASAIVPHARYFWFTDADVEHGQTALRELMWRAEVEGLGLVSTMVRLNCEGLWERLLIPAFVFYFRKLYPFRLVNDRRSRIAAAAGGSMLVRTDTLRQSGGLAAIRGEVIDDCALARRLKQKRGIWLGLTTCSRSLRTYSFGGIRRMVARSAYTQLRCSPLLLAVTIAGLALVYLAPVVGLIYGCVSGDLLAGIPCGLAWALMAVAYRPMIRFYDQPTAAALLLPLASILYAFMTLDSAIQHWRGEGAMWKGRAQA